MNGNITRRFHRGNPESIAAHNSLSVDEKELARQKILGLGVWRKTIGVTCDEAEQILDLRHQTASARITELKRDGLLVPTPARRTTRSGRAARVLVSHGCSYVMHQGKKIPL